MKITPAIQKEMRRLRREGLTYEQIADKFNSYASQVFYYCRDAKDKEQLDKMEQLREHGGDGFGIGMTYAQIGAEMGINKQAVHRLLASRPVKPRRCLYCHTSMIPHGKFRLWCNERHHRAWKRTITAYRKDGDSNDTN